MAYSYPKRFGDPRKEVELAQDYLIKLTAGDDFVQKRVPVTAGAGNGQGRKPKWRHSPTVAIRVPSQFADKLLELAKSWDEEQPN